MRTGKADRDFLEHCFHKLLINFAWWVNKVDREGNNVFEGGFLGLDNITVVDRSEQLPDGAVLEQSDATGWMGMFCLNLMRIALELAKENRGLRGAGDQVLPALRLRRRRHEEHGQPRLPALGRARTASSTTCSRYPDGAFQQVPRALAGRPDPAVRRRAARSGVDRAVPGVHGERQLVPQEPPRPGRSTSSTRSSATASTTYVADDRQRTSSSAHAASASATPDEFLSDYGVRSLSKATRQHPFELDGSVGRLRAGRVGSRRSRAATRTGAGRSGSRPTFLLIESLRKLGKAFGADAHASPMPAARPADRRFRRWRDELADRLIRIFTARRRRPARPSTAAPPKFQDDPHWRDLHPVLRVLPRRQRRRPRRIAPDRLDRAGRVADRRVERGDGGIVT